MAGTISDLDTAIKTLDEMNALAERRKASRLTRAERNVILSSVYSVSLSSHDAALLKLHIIELRKIEGANRAYLFRKSSDYTLMLRYVFPDVADRSNISRWAGALCHLARIGVPPYDFHNGLAEHGPLMELYWKDRDNITRRHKRQTLTLDRSIDFVEGCDITLTLRANRQMIFEVLDFSLARIDD